MVKARRVNGWMKEKNDGLRRRERKRSDGIRSSRMKKLVENQKINHMPDWSEGYGEK